MGHRELGQTDIDVPNRAILHHLARNVLARIPRVNAAEGQHLLKRERASVSPAMTPALRPHTSRRMGTRHRGTWRAPRTQPRDCDDSNSQQGSGPAVL
jgi:hypothetical protein